MSSWDRPLAATMFVRPVPRVGPAGGTPAGLLSYACRRPVRVPAQIASYVAGRLGMAHEMDGFRVVLLGENEEQLEQAEKHIPALVKTGLELVKTVLLPEHLVWEGLAGDEWVEEMRSRGWWVDVSSGADKEGNRVISIVGTETEVEQVRMEVQRLLETSAQHQRDYVREW